MISLKHVDPNAAISLDSKQGKGEDKSHQKKQDSKEKTCLFHLYYSDSTIALVNRDKASQILVIDRKNLATTFVSDSQGLGLDKASRISIYAVWGVIEIKGVEFLVLVSKANVIARVQGHDIYQVDSIKFVTISREKFKNFQHENCWEELKRTKQFLKTGFFFSYSCCLSKSFDPALPQNLDYQTSQVSEDPFVWNYKALKSMLSTSRENINLFVPIIQGFIG